MAKAELVRGKETLFMVNMRARTIGLAALLLLVLATFVMAQPGGAEATLVVSTGQAVVDQGQGTFFATSADTAVSAGEALSVHEGDTIQLAETAAAQLRLKDGSTIDLAGGTTLSISELVSNELNYRARFNLLTGRALSQVVRLLRPNDSFEIKTPSSTASVRGTRFTVEVISSEETYFAVEEGVVQVTMADQAVDVTAGYEVTAVIGQPLQVKPGETTTTPSNNTNTSQPDSNPTAAAAEENTAVPATINSQPQNNTPAAPSSTPRPETTANASSTPKNSVVPSPTSNADEDEVVTNTPTAPMNTPPTTSGSTPSSTPVIAVTNTSAAPTALPTQVPTDTPAPAPTNTLAPLPTNIPAPAPTNTPAPPPTNTPDAEAQVTICHNGSTIEVAASAVDAHLAHGDTLGPCP